MTSNSDSILRHVEGLELRYVQTIANNGGGGGNKLCVIAETLCNAIESDSWYTPNNCIPMFLFQESYFIFFHVEI